MFNHHLAHVHIKNSTHIYAKLFLRALCHQDLRMRLASMIAISEAVIDNLRFQMKVMRQVTRNHKSRA